MVRIALDIRPEDIGASRIQDEIDSAREMRERRAHASELTREARDRLDAGDISQARALLSRARSLWSEVPDAGSLENDVRVARQSRRFSRALEAARTSLETGDLETAADEADAALDVRPEDADALAARDEVENALLERGRRDEAARLADEARELFEAGEPTRARRRLDEALRLDAETPSAAEVAALLAGKRRDPAADQPARQ